MNALFQLKPQSPAVQVPLLTPQLVDMHYPSRRSLLSTRVRPLLLALVALGGGALQAEAAFSQAALDDINLKLAGFAADKGLKTAPTVVTAKADDLVYAVYQVTRDPGFSTAS